MIVVGEESGEESFDGGSLNTSLEPAAALTTSKCLLFVYLKTCAVGKPRDDIRMFFIGKNLHELYILHTWKEKEETSKTRSKNDGVRGLSVALAKASTQLFFDDFFRFSLKKYRSCRLRQWRCQRGVAETRLETNCACP